ncbi:MAG TPA: sigma-70 family RNA polymerase sigma factor [Anaeromyxobacteraceae bacterium]|jgi:RNA polymerase sigma-70 factor (ECF subfamily)|nr:sigma-70 family RNA polymerase sigma factor [Anaeromyxobacteraceae bacterium]
MPERTHNRGDDGPPPGGAAFLPGHLRDAATGILKRHGPHILRYLAIVLRDREAALEVFCTFEEDLWRGMAGFRGESSERTWAHRLAWHAALRYLRDPYRLRCVPLGPKAGLDTPVPSESQGSEQVEERARAVAELRDSLRPEERYLLALRVDQRLSWEEVAAVLTKPGEQRPDPSALRKRFERLKEKLTRRASEAGLLPDSPARRARS